MTDMRITYDVEKIFNLLLINKQFKCLTKNQALCLYLVF